MTRSRSLTARLFAGQALVGLAGTSTLWVVATVIGPEQFRRHLREAGAELSPVVSHHAERAFRAATTISFAAALAAGVAASLLLSLYLTRRLGRSVGTVAAAAADLAAGRLDARISDPRLGAEFDQLAAAFNDMASRLQDTEQTRRRMLGDLAHELRTPLAVLDGYLEGIEDGVETTDARTLEVLRAQTGRLARLAEDIADVSRAEEGQVRLERRTLDVAELVQAATSVARARFDAKGVSLSTELAVGLAVDGDGQRLGQVLGNLLDNALRHTPREGRVTVRTRRGGGGGVLVEVADTGEGIAAESLGHVFERFYRADAARDRVHGGSGIGLAISKALVEAHGGRLTAHSDGPGAGATFVLELPSAA